jgi:hypothetical protein
MELPVQKGFVVTHPFYYINLIDLLYLFNYAGAAVA